MTAGCFYQNYREVRLLIIHCSATRYDRDFPVEALRASHKARGFADIGYHFYITRDGYLHRCRPVNQIGAHAAGWNDRSIGICYEGGLDRGGNPFRHPYLRPEMFAARSAPPAPADYPEAKIVGHCQLSPYIRKACPCFDAREEYAGLEEEVSRK
ncbi:MAG: N-acetylmuramoyl-L-alanine amidase [Parabacteroides merdae]